MFSSSVQTTHQFWVICTQKQVKTTMISSRKWPLVFLINFMAIRIFETSNFVEDDFGYREIVSYKGLLMQVSNWYLCNLAFFLLHCHLCFLLWLLEQPYLATNTVIPLSPTQCLLVNVHIYNTWVVCLLMK